ncbi:hypothetical protein [Andreprevotia chitinilytica]|uniref:hypothetical protein n=1 Tax=Andreprevotia chitinilytica TaxID=396808 RepID=UPI0005576FB3|nr:hypothetical protein [Andreprevotia chitinilytica]
MSESEKIVVIVLQAAALPLGNWMLDVVQVGYAHEDKPRGVVPALVGRPAHPDALIDFNGKRAFVGEEALVVAGVGVTGAKAATGRPAAATARAAHGARSQSNIFDTFLAPLRSAYPRFSLEAASSAPQQIKLHQVFDSTGAVRSWGDLHLTLRDVFERLLGVNVASAPVFVLTNGTAGWGKDSDERLARMLFDDFFAPRICLATQDHSSEDVDQTWTEAVLLARKNRAESKFVYNDFEVA